MSKAGATPRRALPVHCLVPTRMKRSRVRPRPGEWLEYSLLLTLVRAAMGAGN